MRKKKECPNPELLIRKLQELQDETGETPKVTTVRQKAKADSSFPSLWQYLLVFGTFTTALEAAGLEVSKTGRRKEKRVYSEEELIKLFVGLIGRVPTDEKSLIPTAEDIAYGSSRLWCPTFWEFFRVFGSYENLVEKAQAALLERKTNIENIQRRERAQKSIVSLRDQLDRVPNALEVIAAHLKNEEEFVSLFEMQEIFGCLDNALKECGLIENK